MPALLAFFESPVQLLIVGMIVLLLFGNRLPSVMRSLGQGRVEFKKGMQGIEDDKLDKPDEPPKKLPPDDKKAEE